MKYVQLGKTGLKVSAIGFGGIPIQRSNQENTDEVINALLVNNINYIDTARAYTVSEGYIGNGLKDRRNNFIIATKSMARDYDSMKKDIEISLNNLQTDYLDLYQFHNLPIKDIEKVFGENGAYKALEEAKKEGKIKHIGATAHSVESLEILVDKYFDKIETVMFPFNIIENQGNDVLKKAKEKGIGTIAMKPLAGGNITNSHLAARYIANSGLIDIILIGMGSAEEVDKDSNIDLDNPLTKDENKEIVRIREELGTTFCRRCGYCAPCSVGIDIPSNFLFDNYYNHYEGLKQWAIKRYEGLNVKASECIECGQCEERCPYNLPIREMLKRVVKDFEG